MKNIFFTILTVFGAIVVFILIKRHDRHDYKQHVLNAEYFGSVDSLFLDASSKMQTKASLNTGVSVFIEHAIYGKVEKGDTLFKLKGDFKHYLVENGDTTIYFADYLGDEIK